MNAPLPLSVTLTMDDTTRMTLVQDEHALEVAQAYIIDSDEMAQLANGELRSVKERIKKLKELKEGFVDPAKRILENAAALFNPALQSLTASEKLLKDGLSVWTTKQQQLADERQRQKDDEARKERQKAEAEAAAIRAKAKEKADEEARVAREAEAARVKALEEGNAKEAERQAGIAAKATENAVSITENATIKADDRVVAATIATPAARAPEPVKVAGFGMRDNWKAELAPNLSEVQAVQMIASAIAAGRTDMVPLLSINWTAANALAKAQKTLMNVPGIEAKNKPVASSRAA